jgi:hypothetical protein
MDTPDLFDTAPYTRLPTATQTDWAIDTIGEDPSWSEIYEGVTVKARLYGSRAFEVKSISRGIGWATVAAVEGNFQTFLPLSDLSLDTRVDSESIVVAESGDYALAPPNNDSLSTSVSFDSESSQLDVGGVDSLSPLYIEVESESLDFPTTNDSLSTGCIGIYSPKGTARESVGYYRFSWRDGKRMRHRHIPGGNIHSPTARSHREEVECAIAGGQSPREILLVISSWSRYKK